MKESIKKLRDELSVHEARIKRIKDEIWAAEHNCRHEWGSTTETVEPDYDAPKDYSPDHPPSYPYAEIGSSHNWYVPTKTKYTRTCNLCGKEESTYKTVVTERVPCFENFDDTWKGINSIVVGSRYTR